jgi:hypothetical protein
MAQHNKQHNKRSIVILAASLFPLKIIKCGQNNGNNKGTAAPVRVINT